MVITVSIPQTHILHTASLDLTFPSDHPSTITLGQPLPATLRISHTRRWGSPTSLISAANLASPSDPIDFTVTLDAPPDTWLVGGARRALFSAAEDEAHEFRLTLVPLRTGAALLPSVDIRARVKPRESEDAEGLSCETDYRGFGECVVVVPDVRSSTVGVGEMGVGSLRSVVWLEGVGC